MKDESSTLPPKRRSRRNRRKSRTARVTEFPQARGRMVERVELITNPEYHCVSIRFQDKTDLSVVIDPGLSFRAEYSDWKTGNQRVLKRFPPVRSERM